MKKYKSSVIRLCRFSFYALFFVFAACQKNDKAVEMDSFVSSLLNKMTLKEKLGQLNLVTPVAVTGPLSSKNVKEKLMDGTGGNVYAVMQDPEFVHSYVVLADSSRLKIPLLNGLDIIHGYKTVFPIPLGLSCSWDTVLIEKTARVAAIEGSAEGYNWTFSPMVDITRDPRWGRVMEGSGEDPYLGSVIARAMVKGYQGSDLTNETSLMSCVKHIGMYGAAEAGKDYNITDMSRLTMYQNYLPPYKAAIDAGAGSVMTSFNEVDGVPATANQWLLTDLLRSEWGFDGFVVSDANAVAELEAHGVAGDYKQAAVLALNAGVDMDMASESMMASLEQSLNEGKADIKQIDDACRRVLEAKYKLGLFKDPYRNYSPGKAENIVLCQAHRHLSKKAAIKSMVLLKNANQVLPLKKDAKIALVGPFANDKGEMFSMWALRGEKDSVITILEGIKNLNTNVQYAKGTQVIDDKKYNYKTRFYFDEDEQQKMVAEALEISKGADVIVAVLGESRRMFGEARSMTNIELQHCQLAFLKALKATEKPVVLLLSNGRPLVISEAYQYADAILETWKLGTEAGNAVADVLFGNYNPSGKLTMTFPASLGQIPIYYNHKNTGRPYPSKKRGMGYFSNYMDEYNAPSFPFGFGLSYTSFDYGNIVLSDTIITGVENKLTATIRIKNTGKYAGEETAQLYLNDPVASVTRPVKELKKFQKVFLQPQETKQLTFELTSEDLKFYNSKLEWDWEPGEFVVYIGTNSQEVEKVGFVWKR
ncbi:beta-glucosidase [Labilibaculum manganireducens]|uniref:Periplasmic beta-glucosidase n=1 Tax=Labilibaculum manganireducens TaxID=1940525 RepID=A0A2N3HVR7_9BACT|nr:beta-glucosidase BglX [Labilibaculum manganireducens]PKQ62154.1 beta-glucosidase [Labilibaculum manganireducens]